MRSRNFIPLLNKPVVMLHYRKEINHSGGNLTATAGHFQAEFSNHGTDSLVQCRGFYCDFKPYSRLLWCSFFHIVIV